MGDGSGAAEYGRAGPAGSSGRGGTVLLGSAPVRAITPLFCLLLLAFSPASGAPETPPDWRVGVLYWSMQIPGQVAMRQGLEAELKSLSDAARAGGQRGVELLPRVAGDGPEGIERQIAQMNALVDLGIDLIIVQPTDNAALVKPLLRANEAGIPVVAYDQYIAQGRLASFLTSDNHQAGYLDGEYLASRFPAEHTLRLVLVEYPHVSSTVERVNGLVDALRATGQRFEVLATYEAVEPVAGKVAGQAILRDFPKPGSVDAVFTVNDGGGLAVVDELAAAGRSEIVVASVDGDAASVANIRAGRLTGVDSAQFCGALGRETMKVGWRVLHGEAVPQKVLLPVFPITKDTDALFLGWNQPPPKAFDKPWPSAQPTWRWELVEVD